MTPESITPSGRPALRASDADRERTAAALRRHHLDGRIDTDELQERLGRCYAARTEPELAALVADLPPDERPPSARRSPPRTGAPAVAVLLVALAIVATLAGAAHGHPGPFPLLAVFVLLRLGRGARGRFTA